MTLHQAYNICMPPEKQKKERANIWVAYVVRPLSVIATLPLINTKIKPSDITKLSIIFSILGFFLLSIPQNNTPLAISAWLCYFIWAILDGVDGNLARCQKSCSKIGELWDALGGYTALTAILLSTGIHAFFDNKPLIPLGPQYLPLIAAAISATTALLPRLLLHKKLNLIPSAPKINDKSKFGIREIITMNFISVSGFLQVILLIAIITHTTNIFTFTYLLINLAIMAASLRKILK